MLRFRFALALLLSAGFLNNSVWGQYQSRGKSRDPRNGNTGQPHNPSNGTDTGQITSVKFLSGQGKKAGMVDIQTGPGRHVSVNFADEVPIDVARTQLSGQQARPFLVNGAKISISWTDARDPRYVTGKWADKISILTEPIEGTLTSITDHGAAVLAAPKKEMQADRDEPPPIPVNGRTQPKPPARKPPAETKPRQMRLVFKSQATAFTLNGKEAKQSELLAAAKGRSDMHFDAVLLSGAGNVAVQFHLNSDAGPASDKNQGPGKASKN